MRTFLYNFIKLKTITKLEFLLIFFLGFNLIQAQTTGNISGMVTDKSSGDPLPGANVYLEGTSLGAASSFEGDYIIHQIPAGDYTMIIKYIGYKEQKIPVTVKSGKTLEINIALEYVALESKEVLVSAQAVGQIEAINQQLSSNTISNVVSADRIKDIPDANAAETVGRLPGISLVRSGGEGQKVTIRGMSPKYNIMMVNGIRLESTDRDDRSVDLNMIAPNILSGIEVKKALTADMDADAVGGTVNLKISKAQEGFHSNFSAQDGYASLANTQPFGNYRFTGLVSNRFFENKFGVQLSGFLDKINRNSDLLSATYYTNEESDSLVNGFLPTYLQDVTIRDLVTDRQRTGGSLVLDYQLPFGSLLLNNFISSIHQTQTEQRNFFTTSYDWRGYGYDREFTNTVISNALQGEFDFSWINMDFSLSNSVTKQRTPGDLTLQFQTRSGGVQGWEPDSTISGKEYKVSPSRLLNNLQVLSADKILNNLSTLKRDVDETAQSVVLNFKVPFNFSDYLAGDFKLGGKYVRNTRKNDETQWGLDVDRGGLALDFNTLLRTTLWPDLGLTVEDNGVPAGLFADPDYDIGDFLSGKEGVGSNVFYNKISIWKMHHLEELAKESGYYLESPQQSTQYDYHYTRNFYAFYIMAELNISKYVILLPGLRYEKFGFDYTADSTFVFGRLTTPGEHYYDYETLSWDSTKAETWFPQMQMRIKPTDWLDFRLASTKSIIYPDYRAVSPYLYADVYSDPTIYLGNPYLKPAISQNYDIYASIYENNIGLFTAGFFYKEIDNLIVDIEYNTRDVSKVNYRFPLSQTQNSIVHTWTNLEKVSYVRGIELDWQTHFWYLPSFLSGLVFNINYTHINSDTRYPYTKQIAVGSGIFKKYTYIDTTRTGRLQDQPNDILNLTIGYDIGDFSARLSFQYTDNVLRTADNVYKELDSYTAPYYRWDFTAYQKLPWVEGLQVYLDVNNITNRPDRQFSSILEKLSSVEYYGRTADLGVRYRF